MQVLSAAQAISPAIERTRNLLFRPFRWGTFLKLCVVAVLTEGFSGNFNSSHHGHSAQVQPGIDHLAIHFSPAWIEGIAAIALAVFVVSFVIFYLIVRLRFALFECLIHQSTLIAPGWHKYRSQAWRFFLLSIVVGFIFLAVIALISLPFVFGFLHLYQEGQLSGEFPVAGFLSLLLPLIPVILLIVLVAVCVDIILRDFMLPHIALEDASAGQAWTAVRVRIAREKGAFALYAVLRVLLPVVAMLAIFVILAIPGILVFGVLGVSAVALYTAISHAALPLMIAGWFLEALLGLLILGLALLLIISFDGLLAIAVRNYALLFYGSRYQALGEILFPAPPAPPAMQPGTA